MVPRWHLLLCPHMVEVRELAVLGPFYTGTTPMYEASPSWLKYLSKASSPDTITSRARIQHMNLEVTQIISP